VLDDLVHNESAVEILEHATDTAGATETIFAMFFQYGYRLTPRMRNLGDRKLFVIGPSADYAPLAPLIGGTANLSVVEENWDELLRLWASIGSGLAPPSVILRKIAAAPRQNALARALKEIGRIERSIFICEWLVHIRTKSRCPKAPKVRIRQIPVHRLHNLGDAGACNAA
jgi:TnpA family transposase